MKKHYSVRVIYSVVENHKYLEYDCIFPLMEKMSKREAVKEAEWIIENEKYFIKTKGYSVGVRYELLAK